MSLAEHKLSESKLQLILCASEADAEAIRAAGFRSVRVVNDERSIYIGSANEWELDPRLSFFGQFILVMPKGAEGLRDALAVRLDDVRCRWADLGGKKTAADLDTIALRNAIVGARPMWTDEIASIYDIPDPGQQPLFKTGFAPLDEHGLRLTLPSFVTVIGPYGSGKSIFLRQLLVNLYKLHGWRCLLTAFEERVKPRFHRDLKRHFIGGPTSTWTDEVEAWADVEIDKAFRFLQRPRRQSMTGDHLIARIEFAAKVHGIKVVCIDPVNEIDHTIGRGESKTDYMGRFIMSLKALADDYGLLMIVAAHPPKDGVEKRLSRGKLLTLNDGADTSHWGNKSDMGFCLWRPGFDRGPTLLHIDKVKDHESMGKPTLVEFGHNPILNSFYVNRMGYEILGDGEDA